MLKERGKEIDDGIPRKEALMMLKHHEEWESERGLR